MKRTMAEKLLSRACGQSRVRSGDIVEVKPDWIMVHEGIGWGIKDVIEEMGATKLADPDKVVALLDHFTPPPNEAAAELQRICRNFAHHHGLKNYHDMRKGICHQVMVEEYVSPGEVVVGSDSHTTTYGALGSFAVGMGFTDVALTMVTGKTWMKVPETIRFDVSGQLPVGVSSKDVILDLLGRLRTDGATYMSCEFGGDGLQNLTLDSRLSICNMCAEMGAKAALMPADEEVQDYLRKKGRSFREDAVIEPDPQAEYRERMQINLSTLTPRVARPHSPDNVCSVAEAEPVEVDQVFIGGCANGRIEDMRSAARIFKGRTLHEKVRLIVVPASYDVLKKMSAEGILDIFIEAGAVIGASTCGPCFGGHFGLLAAGEVCISTATRNFIGRMGSKKGQIYLASPETAAASAISGRLTDPREFL